MRKRGKPALGQASGSRPAPREPEPKHASKHAPEERLEDDGFVFWPHSLGRPEGPRLVQIERRSQRHAPRPPRRRRRATTALFVALFFAGAALTAAAGNEVATLVASDAPSTGVPGELPADTTSSTTVPEDTTSTTETTGSSETTTTDETVPAETTTTPETETAETTTTTSETTTTTPETEPAETTTTTPPETEPVPPPSGDPGEEEPPPPDSGAGTEPGDTPRPAEPEPQPMLVPQPSDNSPKKARAKTRKGKAKPAYASLKVAPRPDEVEHEATPGVDSGQTRWISEPLPDPTPPSLRLSPQFARELRAVSAANGLDWAFLLAVLRAEKIGHAGQVASDVLERKATTLAELHLNRNARQTLIRYKHDRRFTDRVLVLDRYYRALGLNVLIEGLVASRDELAAKILSDQRTEVYPGGRADIAEGRIDVRVLAMIAFLGESFGDVRVSCLVSGHRLFARPGVISAHIYGRGLDIGALSKVPIYGHQQPGGVTEKAVRKILLLPAEVLPRQVISLIGLGGPSFPLADHADHIHIGY